MASRAVVAAGSLLLLLAVGMLPWAEAAATAGVLSTTAHAAGFPLTPHRRIVLGYFLYTGVLIPSLL